MSYKHEIGKRLDESLSGLRTGEIRDNLDGIAYGMENGLYTKHLTEEEISVAKSELADVSLALAKLEEQKKEAMDDFKDKMKKPKENFTELLRAIRFKSVSKEGDLYLIDDQDNGIMYKYDEDGICVDSRALVPKERQSVIRMGIKRAN